MTSHKSMETSAELNAERISIAIDLAARKIEKLLMISTLCHYLSPSEDHQDFTTCSNRSRKVRVVLGMEIQDILLELIACQKVRNNHISELVHPTTTKNSTAAPVSNKETTMPKSICKLNRSEILRKLQQKEAKRQFLKEVMAKAKMFLQNPGSPVDKSQTPRQAEGNKYFDNDFQIRGRQSLTSSPAFTSVVELLRAALHSKYRTHVRRCFKDLDLESLMSILYLLMSTSNQQSTTVCSQGQDRPRFLSVYSSTEDDPSIDQQIGSYYLSQFPDSESPSDTFDFVWDEEESYIRVEELESDAEDFMEEQPQETRETTISSKNSNVLRQYYPLLSCKESQILSTFSWTNDEITVFAHLQEGEKSRAHMKHSRFLKCPSGDEYSNVDSRTVNLFSKLLSRLPSKIPNLFYEEGSRTCAVKGVTRLHAVLVEFQKIASRLLTDQRVVEKTRESRIAELGITHRLAFIEEQRIKSKLEIVKTMQKQKQEDLDNSIAAWRGQVEGAKQEASSTIRNSVKQHVLTCTENKKGLENKTAKVKAELGIVKCSLEDTFNFVKQSTKSLRARRHYLEASLESLIREYEATMLKYQANVDELSVEEVINSREILGLQNKYKDIEEMYDEMRAMKRLKELLKNMEKADSIKQNWAARRIQVAWRKYKVAKLRKKRLKGKKGRGKKKTPPPQEKGKSLSPPKTSTPGSGSRSKSLTPA